MERMFAASQFIAGEQLAAFEREFAAAMGAPFATGVASGTDAITLALRDAGVTGDVITSALTAPFTAVAIRAAGCTPRFADVDPLTLEMSAVDVERRMTARTRAVVAVHLYGQTCDLGAIGAIARSRGAIVIQDACQAHGAVYQGGPLTERSAYVCYSFYPTKNLGALGDGGAIATADESVAARLRMQRDGGRGARPQVAETWGVNSRLDEMQCCFLRAFLPELREWNAHRAAIARIYDERLAACSGVKLLRRDNSVHHLYVVRAQGRDELKQYLERRGIGTGVHYPVPLHLHPAFSDCGLRAGDLPEAEVACGEVLSLPVWPYMEFAAAEEVAECVRGFYD